MNRDLPTGWCSKLAAIRGVFALLAILAVPLRSVAADPVLSDSFDGRQILPTSQGSLDSSNEGAGVEVNEPRHGGKVGGRSVWVSWIAPEDGIATFQTDGSSFDTLMSAYHFGQPADTTLDKLREDARNDDAVGIAPASLIQIGAQAGVRYEIAIDGFAGASGSIHLAWSFIKASSPPPIIVSVPEDRAARQGDPVTLSIDIPISDRLKFNWRLNGEDILGEESPAIFIPSLQPANLGVYTLRITLKGGNNVGFETPPIELQINSEGETNTLARDKLLDAVESELRGRDESRQGLSAPRPGLVRAAGTGVSVGYNGTQIFDTTFASTDPGEPLHCGVSRNFSYWLVYSAPTNGVVTLDTIGSAYDTVLAVYTYQAPLRSYAELVPVACDNDSVAVAGASRVSFDALAGHQYAFVVAAVGTVHSIAHLNYTLAPTAAPIPPTLVGPPPSRVVAPLGADVILAAAVDGSEPLQYRWQGPGAIPIDRTAASLHLFAVRLEDSGDYTLTVSNPSGSPLSVVFPLRVVAPPELGLRLLPDFAVMSFPSEVGLSYILESSSDPSTGWLPLIEPTPGTGQSLIISNQPSAGARFFRLRVQ